jgi:hypothetical protein
MFGNNSDDGDAEDSTEYEVVNTQTGDEYDRYDNYDEAEDVAAGLNEGYSFTSPYAVDEVEDEDDEQPNGYSFFETETPEADSEDGDPADHLTGRAKRWTLGEHSTASDDTEDRIDQLLGELDDDVDGDLKGVLEEAGQLVSGSRSRVSNFECQVCGLNHGHDDRKHDIRSIFGVTEEFADQMEFNPYCHCGVNELAMLVEFYPYIRDEIFAKSWAATARNADRAALRDTYAVLWEKAGASDIVNAERAARQADAYYDLDDSEIEAIESLYSTVQDIRNAADGAPIPGHVRETISENRKKIEAQIE